MIFSWANRLGGSLLALTLAASPVEAQAQAGTEWGVALTGVASDPFAGTLGLLGAHRMAPRGRLQLQAGLGRQGHDLAWRGELVGHFLLSPGARTRPGLYGGGGVAVAGAAGTADGYVVLLVGVEQRPGDGNGWFVEGGVGGGARVSVGYRWRRLRWVR